MENYITIFKGTSKLLTVEVIDNEGQPVTLVPGSDRIVLTARVRRGDAEKAIAKAASDFIDNTAKIAFEPADTAELAGIRYVYDVQLVRADGSVHELIAPAVMELKPTVTRGEF